MSENGVKECGVVEQLDGYNTSLRVGGLFIILALGFLGSIIPIASKYAKCCNVNQTLMQCLSAFGIGVVIATAFIHMIPPALDQLNNECLEFHESYNGFAMVIVFITVMFMQYVENELVILFSKYNSESVTPVLPITDGQTQLVPSPSLAQTSGDAKFHSLNDVAVTGNHGHSHNHVSSLLEEKQAVRTKITVLIFEIGVALHSVIIGVDLGVTAEDEFKTLLAALCFHQFFEGIAVGTSAVAGVSSLRSVLATAIGYSLTTPIGVAIGIGISGSYSETSATALWVRGILDAIAAGILIYTGVVELLTYQFTMNQEFHKQKTSIRHLTYLCLYAGGAAMSVVGKWT